MNRSFPNLFRSFRNKCLIAMAVVGLAAGMASALPSQNGPLLGALVFKPVVNPNSNSNPKGLNPQPLPPEPPPHLFLHLRALNPQPLPPGPPPNTVRHILINHAVK